MKEATQIRTGRHVVYNLHAHLVFVAKYRRTVFTKQMIVFMKSICNDICKSFGAELKEFDGEKDHIHLMVHYPPKVSLAKLVNSLKGVTSRHLRKQFKAEVTKYYWKNVLWSPSYFAASCGGAPLSTVQKYIQNQKTPT